MLGASLLPTRFRNDHGHGPTLNPGSINRKITPLLQSVSRRAFNHPIRTIVFVALLASTSYVGLLEGSFFEGTDSAGNAVAGTDFNALLESGSRVRVGPETFWEWQIETEDSNATAAQHLILTTLVFKDSKSSFFQRSAPPANQISAGQAKSIRALSSSTGGSLSSHSQDTHYAFSVPADEVLEFLNSVQELSAAGDFSSGLSEDVQTSSSWVMKVAKNGTISQRNSLRGWALNAWSNFVDLIRVGTRPCKVKATSSQWIGSTQKHSTSSLWSLVTYLCISHSSHFSCRCGGWGLTSGWRQQS